MLILGHRGVNYPKSQAMQNSMAAFEAALAACDGFETDACLTSDSVVFLIHPNKGHKFGMPMLDSRNTRMTGNRRIDQLPSELIRELKLRDGGLIPTLLQALDLMKKHKGKIINIELKGFGVADAVIKLLKRHPLAHEAVVISSFDHDTLLTVRNALPAIKIGALLVSGEDETRMLYPWFTKDVGRYAGLQAAMASETLRYVKPELFVMPETMLSMGTADIIDAHFPQAKLAGWTVSEKDSFDQDDLLTRLQSLKPSGKVGAMIVDNPRAFVEAWQHFSGK